MEAVYVDRSKQRRVWINGNAGANTDNEVLELGESEPNTYIRIIRVDEGIIADFSHLGIRNWTVWEKFDRNSHPRPRGTEKHTVIQLPIIYCAFNADELDLIKPALLQQNINPDEHCLQPILDAIEDEDDDEDEIEVFDDDVDEDEPGTA